MNKITAYWEILKDSWNWPKTYATREEAWAAISERLDNLRNG